MSKFQKLIYCISHISVIDWDNTRTIIRKRINGAILADVFWPNLLSEHLRKKFVIEISTIGDIKLYAQDNLYYPILQAFDVNPLPVQYMSIKNYNKEKIDLFYGNNWQMVTEYVDDLIEEKYGKFKEHPVLGAFKQLSNRLNVPNLWKNSQYYESWNPLYTKFIKIDSTWSKPADMRLQFPLIVQGSKDARILLSSTQVLDAIDENVYEIRIGGEDNSLISIGRKIDGVIMGQVYEQNILSPFDLTTLVVEISNTGQIIIWSSRNVYEPLLVVVDPNPLDVKYIGFASSGRTQFFWDINFDLLHLVLPFDNVPSTVLDKHPSFLHMDYPIGFSDLCKYL